jgi:uncharacterized membrane protein YkvA (DUF1232 family)
VISEHVALVRRLRSDPRVPRRAKFALVGLLGYLLCPIDLIPDFIPVLGQLDDVLIAVLVLRYVSRVSGIELRAPADAGRRSR